MVEECKINLNLVLLNNVKVASFRHHTFQGHLNLDVSMVEKFRIGRLIRDI